MKAANSQPKIIRAAKRPVHRGFAFLVHQLRTNSTSTHNRTFFAFSRNLSNFAARYDGSMAERSKAAHC